VADEALLFRGVIRFQRRLFPGCVARDAAFLRRYVLVNIVGRNEGRFFTGGGKVNEHNDYYGGCDDQRPSAFHIIFSCSLRVSEESEETVCPRSFTKPS
jgi:hypothetical protein